MAQPGLGGQEQLHVGRAAGSRLGAAFGLSPEFLILHPATFGREKWFADFPLEGSRHKASRNADAVAFTVIFAPFPRQKNERGVRLDGTALAPRAEHAELPPGLIRCLFSSADPVCARQHQPGALPGR